MERQKDEWVIDFIEAAQRLRPHLTRKFAWTIAVTEYPASRELKPAVAAQRWHARSKT